MRDRIGHTPVGIEITHGMVEQLYGRDLVLEDLSKAGVILGDAQKAHHQVTLDRVICRNVPQLVLSQDAQNPARFFRTRSSRLSKEYERAQPLIDLLLWPERLLLDLLPVMGAFSANATATGHRAHLSLRELATASVTCFSPVCKDWWNRARK